MAIMEKEQPERIINRHYIGVVREVDDYLIYEKVDIPQEDILIGKIEAMKKNENRTLLDIQDVFTASYPEESFENKYYDYLYPRNYHSAYVNGVKYPIILTREKYKEKITKREAWYRSEEFLTSYYEEKIDFKLLKMKSSEEDYNEKIEELVKEAIWKYKNDLREGFCCQYFIFAHNYNTKLREIENEENVKMFSTDQIGWKEFRYKVNSDITIYIKTNFGYGSASYFFCNLKYKGINILPYTWIVKYYYVEMMDFVRYTRMYRPSRTSWNDVFEFVVHTANMAKHEPEIFIKEWIVNEIEEMMKGVRLILSCPEKELKVFLDVNRKTNLYEVNEVAGYVFKDIIRNCNNRDMEEYRAMPNEKVIAFKAEKVTGCLLLLDNLRKLNEITPAIIPYIVEIEKMNIELQPEIERYIGSISVDIDKLLVKWKKTLKTLDSLKEILKSHKQEIVRFRKEINKERDEQDKCSKKDAEQAYEKEHPEYIELKNEIMKLSQKEDSLFNKIELREHFLELLKKCKKRISKYIEAE